MVLQYFKWVCLAGIVWISGSCNSDTGSGTRIADGHLTHHLPLEDMDSSLVPFIPKGYELIWYKEADIDLDDLSELIMVLVQTDEQDQSDSEHGRPALRLFQIITRDKNGREVIRVLNKNVIECIDCSGPNGDAFKGITTRSNGFDIEFEIMNEQYWKEIKSFDYDTARHTWILISDHFINYKSEDPSNPNATLTIGYEETLTPEDFGTISIQDFNIYNPGRR
ncbi:MAG: hypothetical protein KL787_11165 [Taibaiella sp.]|nr:hypothetical protein [Taibaiella sp.]